MTENAVTPTKANPTDTGFDITLISKIKTDGDVEFYGTGLKITPADGWAFLLFPRSSISKTGYMYANSVGVIDSTYTGEVMVALRKVDKDASDIKLPVRFGQLVPMLHCVYEFVQVDSLDSTARGDGGFGSTGQ
jgi:dUTP pyrophosphatase